MMDLEKQLHDLKKSITFVEAPQNYDCDKCKDKGHTIVTRSDGMEAIQPCSCRKVNPVDRILRFHYDTDTATKFRSITSSDYSTTLYGESYTQRAKQIKRTAVEFVKKYEKVKTIKPDLYLFSERPGSGKTMLGCIVCSGITKMHGLASQVISTAELMQMIRRSFNDKSINEDDIINKLTSVPVLLLDDIGTEKHGDYTEEIFTTIIDRRLSKGITTVYTSNLGVNELPYHARIKDRITSNAIRIDFPPVSVRSLEGDKKLEQAKRILSSK